MALSAAVAPAALSRLQSLEKHLENEDFAFSEETVQCFEDTIAAIQKLEEIRRHTLECLEEETIKNSKLRFRVQNFPGEITAEMTALVTAARESSAARISQLQSAVKSIEDEIELLDEKRMLCERQNAALCKEQEYLQALYKEKVDLLNEKMTTKANTNVLLDETCDKIRDTEREIIKAKAALEELKEKIAQKMSKLEKEIQEWEEKGANICLPSSQTEKMKLDSELALLQSKIAQEKEDFNKELEKTEEDLHSAKCLNKKLKFENKALRQKCEQALEEEQHWARKRDETVAKLGKLTVLLDEKLESLAKYKTEKKNLEKQIENLEDSLRNMKKSYEEELAILEQELKTETEMRVMLQWKLLYLAQQRKLLFSEYEKMNRKFNERIEAGKKRHAELLLEVEDLEKELLQSKNQVKALSKEASKKENDYRIYNEDLTNKIKCLQNDIKTATEKLLQKEQELNISRLTLEEIQGETQERNTKYEELRKSVSEKKDEEMRVKRAIEQSVRTSGKLKEDTVRA
ncbi:coiled-coil domain-containing protein 175 [Aegotheles albertisi]